MTQKIEIERIETTQRMSKIVKHNGVAYLCGQVGVRGTSITEQTHECIRRIETLLEQAGSSPKQILQAIIWLSDMKNFDAMNQVWDNWIPEGHAPARACGQTKLASPELLIEITIIAAYE